MASDKSKVWRKSSLPETAKISEAKDWLREAADDGAMCPCCNQPVKIYRRRIHSTMAQGLITIYKHFERMGFPQDEWVHIHSMGVCRNNEGALLRHWKLLQKQSGKKDDGNPNFGFYRITRLGIAFVQNRVAIPKYIYTYNSKVLRFGEERVRIPECLGKGFNYDELMGPAGFIRGDQNVEK